MSNRSFAWIFLLGLVLIIAGLWLTLTLGDKAPWYLSLPAYGSEHLGVVIVVALLLKATLEAAGQREFITLVNKEVRQQIAATTQEVTRSSIQPLDDHIQKLTKGLTYRITNLFDEPLQRELEKSVFNPKFFRPEYTLHLRLKPLAGGAGTDLLDVGLHISYQVKNVSTEDAEYPISFWIDDVIQSASARCRFTRVAYSVHADPEQGYDISELEARQKIVRRDGVLSLDLDAGAVKPDQSLFVDIEAQQLMRDRDHFVWNLVGLTQKLNIIVDLLDGLSFDNFQVFPKEMHHMSHEVFLGTAQRPDKHTLRLQIDQVLLPFQGVEIRWCPIPAPAANPA